MCAAMYFLNPKGALNLGGKCPSGNPSIGLLKSQNSFVFNSIIMYIMFIDVY